MYSPSRPFYFRFGPLLRLEPASNSKAFLPIDIDLTGSSARVKLTPLFLNDRGDSVGTCTVACEPFDAWCDPNNYFVCSLSIRLPHFRAKPSPLSDIAHVLIRGCSTPGIYPLQSGVRVRSVAKWLHRWTSTYAWKWRHDCMWIRMRALCLHALYWSIGRLFVHGQELPMTKRLSSQLSHYLAYVNVKLVSHIVYNTPSVCFILIISFCSSTASVLMTTCIDACWSSIFVHIRESQYSNISTLRSFACNAWLGYQSGWYQIHVLGTYQNLYQWIVQIRQRERDYGGGPPMATTTQRQMR